MKSLYPLKTGELVFSSQSDCMFIEIQFSVWYLYTYPNIIMKYGTTCRIFIPSDVTELNVIKPFRNILCQSHFKSFLVRFKDVDSI